MQSLTNVAQLQCVSVCPAATPSTDEALVARILARDARALEETFSCHGRAVHAAARRILHSGHLAEDIVQDVFLKLWLAPDRFNATRGSLRGFLSVEARGRSLEYVRSEGARRRREERAGRELVGSRQDPEHEAWLSVRADLVHSAISELAPGQRDAISLAYQADRTYREVADQLDLPEGTVKSRIRLGLAKLGNELEHVLLAT